MFERLRIKLFGYQPAAKISDKMLDKIIVRDYNNDIDKVKNKLDSIKSDNIYGKNRFSAAILKLSNGDINQIDNYIRICNNDYRDVVSKAEYPRISKFDFIDFDKIDSRQLKDYYLKDWTDYINWINK